MFMMPTSLMIPSPVQLCAVLTFGLLAGCMHPVASEQPPAAMRVNPLAETQAGVSAQPLPERWWQLYQDPQLGRWVERALANNQD
ncbi:MAG TPA: multidrug transporter, partial [Pseudomonas sp.]|nr:multidrug transporter [Pseudomonas sp.]